MNWKRPSSVPVGKVWMRFSGKSRDGKPAQMYQIRDVEERHRKQCLDFLQEIFLKDEPLSKVLDIKSDTSSVLEIRQFWEGMVDQGVCMACYTDEDGEQGELVAYNNLIVNSRDDLHEDIGKVEGVKWRQLVRVLTEAESLVNIFDLYKVDHYLSGSGVTVSPKHRGQNIFARMLEARDLICKAMNIGAVSTVFTAYTSQALAKKCGYELLATLNYSDMKKYGIDLTACDTPYAEVRGKKVQLDS